VRWDAVEHDVVGLSLAAGSRAAKGLETVTRSQAGIWTTAPHRWPWPRSASRSDLRSGSSPPLASWSSCSLCGPRERRSGGTERGGGV